MSLLTEIGLMKLLLITSFVFALLTSPSWGNEDEVIYECDYRTSIGFFKVGKINNKPVISVRKNLDWLGWCTEENETLEMFDEGGLCHIKYHEIDENTTIKDQTLTFDLLMKTVVNVNKIGEILTYRCKIFN